MEATSFAVMASSIKSPRILVADDQQDFLDFTVDGLRELLRGVRVEGACGGHDALVRIGNLEPDLLVLDLRMPGGPDGFEVCRRVREAPATKATKIVATTGFDDREAEQLAMTCGADAFVIKQANLTALARQITSLLDADTDIEGATRPARARVKAERPAPGSSTAKKRKARR
jgi:CheY-like chemotaxis protein